MDTIQNFSGRANDYMVGRPAYAYELIESLYSQYGFSNQSVIADIGSGTGKFAKQLLEKGSTVFGIEPNDDMRNAAEKELGQYKNFISVKGAADFTGILEQAVDFITVAQAFHWFCVEAFRKECKRILKQNGKVILIWNVRDRNSIFNQECFSLYSIYCPKFKGFSGGMEKDDGRIKQFFNNHYDYISFENPLFYNKEKFISRSLSGSYSLTEGDANYQEYMDSLCMLFDKYSENGIVKMANQTVAYIGVLS